MMEEKNKKADKERKILSNKVEPILRELHVKMGFGPDGREFAIPRAYINYYSLEEGDALLCELVELKYGTQVEKIGEEIVVNITGSLNDIDGEIPEATFDLYNMRYKSSPLYALLRIKKVIKQK